MTGDYILKSSFDVFKNTKYTQKIENPTLPPKQKVAQIFFANSTVDLCNKFNVYTVFGI